MTKGKLIVIEGLEGAGKSSAIHTILDYLSAQQIPCINTREPGGTPIGEILRGIFKNPEYKEVLEDKSELLLLYTARIQLIEQVIKPALDKGIWVIADRFELSTYAYQGGGRGINKEIINTLSRFALEGFTADLTLFLDIDPHTGLQRVQQRGAFDRIELQNLDFFARVSESYKEVLQSSVNACIIDAKQPIAAVQEQILNRLQQFLNE